MSSPAVNRRLSHELPRRVRGSAGGAQVSPDGGTVVYTTSGSGRFINEIYSISVKGGNAVRLDEPSSSILTTFGISLDSRWVIYLRGDALFSVPIDGSEEPGRLDVEGPSVYVVRAFQSAFGGRVVYRTTQNGIPSLYSVPVDGSEPPTLLTGAFVHNGSIGTFQVTPDGTRVVYVADQRVDDLVEIYSVPVEGDLAPAVLNGLLATGGDVFSDFQISPGGERVVYRADQDRNGVAEIYSAPIDGSAPPLKLNGTLVTGGDVQAGFRVSPEGTRVLFLADLEQNNRIELFSAPIDGGSAAVKLNGVLAPGANVSEDFVIAPDDSFALYAAHQEGASRMHLFRVPIGGDASPIALTDLPAPGFDFQLHDGWVYYKDDREQDGIFDLYTLSTSRPQIPFPLTNVLTRELVQAVGALDGRLVYRLTFEDETEIFSVPLDGSSSSVRLNGPLVEGGTVAPFSGVLSSEGPRVVYQAQQESTDVFEVYSVALDGDSEPIRLSGFVPGSVLGDVIDFAVSASTRRVVYLAARYDEEDSFTRVELFSVDLDAAQAPLELFPGTGAEEREQVVRAQLDPAGATVIFTARDHEEISGLFSVPIDGRSPAVQLDVPATGSVNAFTVSDDGDTVAYFSFDDFGPDRLFAVSARGETAPIELSGLLNAAFALETTPDGRVLYTATPMGGTGPHLYSVPMAGTSAPVLLSSEAAWTVSVAHFLVGPQGSQVVYLADQEADSVFELFSRPVDGSGTSVRLNGPLVTGGQVMPDFRIAGSTVVYRSDQEADEVFELFGVPILGGAGPSKLSGPMHPDGDVLGSAFGYMFDVSPDGAYVVYLADALVDETVELFSAPIDGLHPPKRLNPTLVPGGDLFSTSFSPGFRVSPCGTQVAFLADGASDESVELYVVPIDGSGPARQLNERLVKGGDVLLDVRFSADCRQVAFVADALADEVCELFAVSLDRDGAPMRLNGLLVEGGDIVTYSPSLPQFEFAADGAVVYLADQDTFAALELYVTHARQRVKRSNQPKTTTHR